MSLNTQWCAVQCEAVAELAESDEGLLAVLTEQAKALGLTTLLAHHDDGVTWGRWDGQSWSFTAEHFPDWDFPAFRAKTLQQCRAFGSEAELLLWRVPSGLNGKILTEKAADPHTQGSMEPFDLEYLLWGTRSEETRGGFLLLCEGRQGLRHAPPLPALPRGERGVLTVRHYIDYAEHQAYVRWTRLVALATKGARHVHPKTT